MRLHIPPVVKWLLIINFAVFVVQQTADQFFGGNLLYYFALIPYAFLNQGKLWQLFTYMFLHADVWHLFFNLLMMAFLAGELESVWGKKKFLKFYFFCGAFAGLCYIFMYPLVRGAGGEVPMVGASGAIYGVLMAYGILFAERTLLFMMLFPMKAKHFVWILAGIQFMTTLFSPSGGASALAHLGGMGAGFIYLYGIAWWKVRRKTKELNRVSKDLRARHDRVKEATRSGRMKLIVSNPESAKKEFSKDSDDGSDPTTWH